MATPHEASHHTNPTKIYLTLLVLFAISVAGPTLGIKAVTLITAFGIAIVKATLVAAHFMELKVERRYIWYLMSVMLVFLLVLFAGVAPDVMNQEGRNWKHIPPSKLPQPLHEH